MKEYSNSENAIKSCPVTKQVLKQFLDYEHMHIGCGESTGGFL